MQFLPAALAALAAVQAAAHPTSLQENNMQAREADTRPQFLQDRSNFQVQGREASNQVFAPSPYGSGARPAPAEARDLGYGGRTLY